MKPLPQPEPAPASIPPPNNSPSSNEAVTLGQVLRHWCSNGHQNASNLFHIWFAQNVYPLVTPKRIFHFFLSQISFFLAFACFTQTELYQLYINGSDHGHDLDNAIHQVRPMLFLVAAFGVHTVCLIFLLFFGFCSVAFERCRYHYLLKSLGEYLVKLLVVFLIVGIGEEHHHPVKAAQGLHAAPAPINHTKVKYSQVAGLATWCLLTIDAFSIVNLLEPGHHYTLLEVTVTLTLHLGWATTRNCFRIPAAAFVLVIVVVKNYLWRHTHHPVNYPNLS